MILTQEFFTANNVCAEGQVIVDTYNLVGMDIDEAIKLLLQNNLKDDAGWILKAKSSEWYVRHNGSVFTMGAYQVFNPFTGVHTRYETEQEAKTALTELIKLMIQEYNIEAVQELSNENGDTTWIPTDIAKSLVIS